MLTRLLIVLVRLYQLLLSPLFGGCCRFQPTCSHYALACLARHGAWAGLWLTVKRIARCHPFHPGGYDPAPLAVRDGKAKRCSAHGHRSES